MSLRARYMENGIHNRGQRGRPLEKARATLHLFILLFSPLTFNALQYVRQVSLSHRVGNWVSHLARLSFYIGRIRDVFRK